jgi:hypothetical protein
MSHLGDQGIYATFMSNKCLDNFPQNTSSSFVNQLPRPFYLDPDTPYYFGVCSISYADTYRLKDPKEFEEQSLTKNTLTGEINVADPKTYFNKNGEDARVRVAEIIEVTWIWTMREEDSDEFYTTFMSDANIKFGELLQAISDFPEEGGEPITELNFKDKDHTWTLVLNEDIANVLGFIQTQLKPGIHRSGPFNRELYTRLPSDTEFRMALYKEVEEIIQLEEPDEHTLDALCNDISTALLEKGYDFSMPLMPSGYVKMQLDFTDKRFKVNLPPALNKMLRVPNDYFFSESKEYFIYDEDELKEDEANKKRLKLHKINAQVNILSTAPSDLIHLNCSIVEPSIFGNTSLPIVRTFQRVGGTNRVSHITFPTVYFHRLNSAHLSLVEFKLLDSSLIAIKPNTHPTTITCIIKKHLF